MKQAFLVLFIAILSGQATAQEGVSTEINPARLNEVMEWVENAKYSLDTNLENIQRSSIEEQEARYESLIDTILLQSGDKPNEFLMRNVLHRTKVVYQSLKHVASSPKRDVLARRLLEKGVTWAQSLYEPDLNLVKMAREGRLTEVLRGTEFAKIGIQWAEYMLDLYYLAPTNTIKLQLMKDMMGLMYNDINNDDAVKRILAPISGAVVFKNEEIKRADPKTNLEKLKMARDLRRFMDQQLEQARKIMDTYAAQIEAEARQRLVEQARIASQKEIELRLEEEARQRKHEEDLYAIHRVTLARSQHDAAQSLALLETERRLKAQARVLGAKLVEAYNVSMVNDLIKQGADVTYQVPGQNDALQNAAMTDGGAEMVKALLKAGADKVINRRGLANLTALHWAAFGGRSEIIELLLNAGANTQIEVRISGRNDTALSIAKRNGHYDAARILEAYASEGL